jgi:hypothetical protein
LPVRVANPLEGGSTDLYIPLQLYSSGDTSALASVSQRTEHTDHCSGAVDRTKLICVVVLASGSGFVEAANVAVSCRYGGSKRPMPLEPGNLGRYFSNAIGFMICASLSDYPREQPHLRLTFPTIEP